MAEMIYESAICIGKISRRVERTNRFIIRFCFDLCVRLRAVGAVFHRQVAAFCRTRNTDKLFLRSESLIASFPSRSRASAHTHGQSLERNDLG